jgi:ADP-ribose pyrophosphatase
MPDENEPQEPWKTLDVERPIVTPWYSLRRDRVLTHTGAQIAYTYIEHPGAVFIVPVTPQGEVLLLRQYRYPVRAWCWEVPAGGIERGEDPTVATARELQEEIGGASPRIQPIAAFYASNGISDQRSHVYLAWDVELRDSLPEPTELLRVVRMPLDEALRMARGGEIADGQSALALLLCEPYLRAGQGHAG